ncbi:type VI secretion system baseplate subunit TssF [Ostreiculturibacter nitratireducens]|uniref:type VI secretion system baseplate subunit TssF n=1 Tax=Ostreiculturibacter nitratireducens TaxID=3075226 RepID=UPI0031B5AE5E
MDTRILKHYEAELAFLRDMGAEFAQAYPKIAARLGMDEFEVVDPYVERLLEGVAFLSARVQLELELQYPALTSHLLEIVYPHYLAPTPSMMVAALEPDLQNAALNDGYVLPRHSTLRSVLGEDDKTACVFRTASDVTLWPVTISEAEYIDSRGEVLAAGVSRGNEARAAIRLRLCRSGGLPISELTLDSLVLFLGGQEGKNWKLLELLSTQVTGLAGRSTNRRADWTTELPNGRVRPRGFEPEEALLPAPRRSFDGYRLLQEYFAMPERFHFVELQDLSMALARAEGADVDLYILLREGDPGIAASVTPDAFILNAVPAINLFHRRCDRIHVTSSDIEQHVVADRTAPLDFEIYALESVTGVSAGGEDDVTFRPFYSADDLTAAGETHAAYYTQHRKMRERSEKERLKGVRTSYLGSELYLALVDPKQAPYSAALDQLAITAMVTNRDLPLLLPNGARDIFHLPDGGPVSHVSTPVSPTRPRSILGQGDTAWRLISHLSLNYLSIAETGQGDSAAALRELVGIYVPSGNRVLEKQLEGLVSVSTRPIVRRMADEVLSTAVRGLEITILFDESFFEGTSVYLLGAVLERFFRKYVSINSFTETVLVTQQRGEIARWRPEAGLGRII